MHLNSFLPVQQLCFNSPQCPVQLQLPGAAAAATLQLHSCHQFQIAIQPISSFPLFSTTNRIIPIVLKGIVDQQLFCIKSHFFSSQLKSFEDHFSSLGNLYCTSYRPLRPKCTTPHFDLSTGILASAATVKELLKKQSFMPVYYY